MVNNSATQQSSNLFSKTWKTWSNLCNKFGSRCIAQSRLWSAWGCVRTECTVTLVWWPVSLNPLLKVISLLNWKRYPEFCPHSVETDAISHNSHANSCTLTLFWDQTISSENERHLPNLNVISTTNTLFWILTLFQMLTQTAVQKPLFHCAKIISCK